MRKVLYTLSLTLLLGMTLPARAAIVTPAGLNPGQQFRIVFVTSTTTSALSDVIATYDAIVSSDAAAGGLDTYNGSAVTWQTIGSTPSVDAIDRLPADSVPLFLPDGTQVAASGAALWDTFTADLLHGIDQQPNGVTVPFETDVWTGTLADGSGMRQLGNATVEALYGRADATSPSWIEINILGKGNGLRLYGFSSVLTVPQTQAAVPEPASVTLLVALGVAGLAGNGWRRRKRVA